MNVHVIPYDQHLEEGGEIIPDRLNAATKRAYRELTAKLASPPRAVQWLNAQGTGLGVYRPRLLLLLIEFFPHAEQVLGDCNGGVERAAREAGSLRVWMLSHARFPHCFAVRQPTELSQ
nr:hypothetical protein [Rhodococcus globerulus]